jgi:NAD-dependent dihydropyrimidine dehydrogenase PreA subunit
MLKKLNPKRIAGRKGVLKETLQIEKINFNAFHRNIVTASNGQDSFGVCINCDDKPCINYSEEEINPKIIDCITFNNDRRVCPVRAIEVNTEGFPSITDDCIGCGLCVNRCKYGAINLSLKDNTAVIHIEETMLIAYRTNRTINERKALVSAFIDAKKSNSTESLPKENSIKFYSQLKKAYKGRPDLELIIVRNFLINCGIDVKVTAQGNNDNRLDLLGKVGSYFIIGEVELKGNDILGLPRRALEDIAITQSRFGIEAEKQIPILIFLEFPNKRSDIYEVITDISKVLGIQIKTIPFHFLYVSNMLDIRIEKKLLVESFYIDKDNPSFSTYAREAIPDLENIDSMFNSSLYTFSK